jgi:hypothetical protein
VSADWIPLPVDFAAPLVTVKEAASYIRAHPMTIHQLCWRGELVSYLHHGRRLIDFASLKRHLMAGDQKPNKRPRGRPRRKAAEELTGVGRPP